MDASLYDNLDQLILVLRGVFAGDNQTIKRTQEALDFMLQDSNKLMDSMAKILTTENSDKTFNQIKKAACVVIQRMLSPLFDKKDTPEEQKTYILESILTCLYSTSVLPAIKANLQQTLIIIYHSEREGVLKQKSMAFAIEKLATQQINDYAASLLLIKAIIEDPLNTTNTLAEWFVASYEGLLQAGNTLIEGIGSEINELVKGTLQEEKLAHVYVGLEVLKIWTRIIREFIKKLSKTNRNDPESVNYMKIIIDKEDLAKLLIATFVLNIPSNQQIKDCMFAISSLVNLDQLLNTVKTNSLKCFEYILDSRLSAQKEPQQNETLLQIISPETNKFYQLVPGSVLKVLLQSLIQLSRSNYEYIEAGVKDKFFHECLVEGLIVLALSISFQDLYPIFSTFKADIIIDICFPLIASTREDLELFKEDPQAFVNLTIGFNDEHETDDNSAKLQAIYLIKRLCQNIDGATSALIWVVGSFLEYSFHSNDINDIPTQFPKLAEYKDSAIISGIQPKVRVETCLLVLAGVHQYIISRKDLVPLVDHIFTKYHEYFLGPDADALTKTRMCLFLGFYASFLFKTENNQPLYAKHLEFIIQCAGCNDPQQQTVAEQANQTLLEMLTERGSVYRMIPFIAEILEKLTSYIKHSQSLAFFEVIHEIVKIYHRTLSKAPKVIGEVMLRLVERAKVEYDSQDKDHDGFTVLLSRIFSIICSIGESKDFLTAHQEDIETALLPLFSYLENDEEFPFVEYILHYMTSAIKITEKVSPTLWKIFTLFPKILEQERGLITSLFSTLNLLIVHGKNTIEENQEILHVLIDMGIKGLNPTHPDAGKAGPAMAALLFQVLIQYVGIPNEEWERMLGACVAKLEDKDKSFLKARLGGVFLLAFLRNFELTAAILVSKNALDRVLSIFIHQSVVFENHEYDRKVYLIGLCKFLTLPEPNPIIITKLPHILEILVSYLRYVQYVERQREAWKKKRRDLGYESDSDDEEKEAVFGNKDILRNLLGNNPDVSLIADDKEEDFDDESDEEDYDEEDDVDDIQMPTEKDEVNCYASEMISGIKTEDEFVAFKQAINKFKEQNHDLLVKIAGNLSDVKKEFMKDVIQSQRVLLDPAAGATQARKMVKPVARKIATIKDH